MGPKKNIAANYKHREENFNLTSLNAVKRNEYNALFDPNMQHFFQNGKVQRFLYKTGQIDAHGRVIDMDKNKSKICILDKEFKEAERVEGLRLKEELEMRVCFAFGLKFFVTSQMPISIEFKENAFMNLNGVVSRSYSSN
jgi:hypothetical protein